MSALTTLSLLLYFVALDLAVGGTVVAVSARLRATPPHRELFARLVRALPGTLVATALLGAAVVLVLRAQGGVPTLGPAVSLGIADQAPAPRLLHTLLSCTAIAGLWLSYLALRLRAADPPFGFWLARHGAAWTVLTTVVNLFVGGWWLVRLPYPTFIRFTGADRGDMITFAVAVIAALLALTFAALSVTLPDPRRYQQAATAGFAVTLGAMVRMREVLRPPFPGAADPAWGLVAAGGVLAAGGLYMLARASRAFVAEPSGFHIAPRVRT